MDWLTVEADLMALATTDRGRTAESTPRGEEGGAHEPAPAMDDDWHDESTARLDELFD